MKILAIETSCDETGISIIDANGSIDYGVSFTLLADTLASQAELHSEYGGVYPTLAKREHIKALPLLLKQALQDADITIGQRGSLTNCVDAIAVTHGPGLEPALWTGITFAQELATKWSIPTVPVNHMEGHIYSALLESNDDKKFKIKKINYPAIGLLISGGHTDMVLIKSSFNYEYLGGTIDDAVGEAFDKVARMLGLGYPGGPIISKLAQEAREDTKEVSIETGRELPRPMLHSGDYNFSFSGLKTAVLYKVKEIKERLVSDELPTDVQREIAREFEDSVAEVLASKMSKAMQEYNAETLIIGGGVAANSYINNTLRERLGKDINEVEILTPYKGLSGDNALMMAVAGYLRAERGEYIQDVDNLRANGTLKL
jgi:N6-L-threonylcarbamoyladenine synthase